MNIILKRNFFNNFSSNNKIKYLSNLNKEETDILLDFLMDILNNQKVCGKNKPSSQLPNNINNKTIKNYAVFFLNHMWHYHLGKDNVQNSISNAFKYNPYNNTLLVPKYIYQKNEKNGEFKSCNAILNYHTINNELIIYNITLHKAWSDIINDMWIQGLPANYTYCPHCSSLANNNSCNCPSFSSKIHNVGIHSITKVAHWGTCTIENDTTTKVSNIIEKELYNYNNYSGDILISSNEDLYNLILGYF